MTQLKFAKVEAGLYVSTDGHYATVVDGWSPSKSNGADRSGYEGFQGGEWAAVYDPRGRLREDSGLGGNLDWFATKREAVEHCQRHANSP